MFSRVILLFCTFLIVFNSQAQVQRALGTSTYPETSRSIQQTADGGYILGGYTATYKAGEATLIKTSATGIHTWNRHYGGIGTDAFSSVRPVANSATPSLGYVAAGYTTSFGFGKEDVYLVVANTAGGITASKTFGGLNKDLGHCVQNNIDANGKPGYIIVGETSSFTTLFPGTNVYVVQTDQFGNLTNSVVIGGGGDERGFWIEQTSDRGYILVGSTTRNPCSVNTAINEDILVVKLDANLNVTWNRIFGKGTADSQNDVGYCIRENANGTYIITGTSSFGTNTPDAFLLNISAAGGFIWMKTYGGPRTDEGRCVLTGKNPATGALEYVVSGYANSFSPLSNYDAYAFKTDASGNPIWVRSFASTANFNDFTYELDNSGNTGYAYAGEVRSFGTGTLDNYLILSDLNGKTGTCETAPTPIIKKVAPCVSSSIQAVRVDPSKTVVSTLSALQYLTLNCSTSTTPNPPSSRTEAESSLEMEQLTSKALEVFPNPVSSELTFKLNPTHQGARVTILNVQGRKVSEFTIQKGAEQNRIGVATWPKGLYLLQVAKPDGTVELIRFVKQ